MSCVMKRKMDCIPDLPRVKMLCIMFPRRSLRPRLTKSGGRRGWGGIFSPTRQKVFLRLRLGGWMTRKVIGDFREQRWFYFFPLESWFSVGIGGEVLYLPFLTLLPTALEKINRPLALLVPWTGQLFHHEIGRAPLFCRLLLPLSDIPYIRHASKPYRTIQQKSKWLPFQFLFRRAKPDARFSPYPIFNPSIDKKNRKKTFLRTFPDALFFQPSLFSPPFSTPLHIQALDIALQPVDTKEKNQRRKHVVWQNDKSSSRLVGKTVEISFPSLVEDWGGDPAAATPSTISCPGEPF